MKKQIQKKKKKTTTKKKKRNKKMKYQRMGATVPSLLSNDAASCAERMIALGTHSGSVHILDFLGNQLESGNPDYEAICSMGNDIKSVMGFIPKRLRVAMETRFSFQYVELKSLFFTRFDASRWARIETELGYTRDSETSRMKAVHCESHVPAAKLLPPPKPSSSNRQIATSLIVVKSESQTGQASKNSRE